MEKITLSGFKFMMIMLNKINNTQKNKNHMFSHIQILENNGMKIEGRSLESKEVVHVRNIREKMGDDQNL